MTENYLKMKKIVSSALREFNRWHGAEAIARLISVEKSLIRIELKGPFCRTCGLYDYFDDLRLELEKSLENPVDIAEAEADGDESFLVVFQVMGNANGNNVKGVRE